MAPLKNRNAAAFAPWLSKRPHFFKLLIPNPFIKLHIPQNFMKHLDGEQFKKATLLSPLGKFWNIDLHKEGNDLYLDGGWSVFAVEHDLRTGYFVMFRYEGNMLFTVKVFDETCCLKEYELASCESSDCSLTSNDESSEVACPTLSQSSAHEVEAECNDTPSSKKRNSLEVSRGEITSPTNSPSKKTQNDLPEDSPSNLTKTFTDSVPEGLNDLPEDPVLQSKSKVEESILEATENDDWMGSASCVRDEEKSTLRGVTRRRIVKNLHKRIFEEGGLQDGTVLTYRHHNKVVLTGVKQGNAIKCSCHNYELAPSKFEAHAGQGQKRHPYRYIYNSDGKSLHELSLELPCPRSVDEEVIRQKILREREKEVPPHLFLEQLVAAGARRPQRSQHIILTGIFSGRRGTNSCISRAYQVPTTCSPSSSTSCHVLIYLCFVLFNYLDIIILYK